MTTRRSRTLAALLALVLCCLLTLPAAAHPYARHAVAARPSRGSRLHESPQPRRARHTIQSKPHVSRTAAHRGHRKSQPAPRLIAARASHTAVPLAPVVSIIRRTAEKPQLAPVDQLAGTPMILPSLYNQRGRLVMPPPLRGSHEILLHQNEVADRDGLERIQDDDSLEAMRRQATLVALPVSAGMQVDDRLPVNRRYCRPWTAQFLAVIARAHYARFHTPLQINSAVRTVAFQQHLLHINGNAAPADGETASPHLTGQAVDLAKRGLSLSEIAWLRGYLLPLVQDGKIDVEEEFQQSCFHVSVYKNYQPTPSLPPSEIATTHRDTPTVLALAIH